MRLFPPPLDIGPTEGFSPDKDIFGRAELGRGLANLVKTVSDPLVIGVDGQWGSGKTTFLKMWAGQLRKDGFPVIYFDAFEHDYLDDAFMAVAGEIIALVKAKKKSSTPAGKRFLRKAITAGRIIAKAGIRVGAKAATLGALDGTEFKDVAGDVGDAIADVSDDYLGKLLVAREQERNALEDFRSALMELPALLANSNSEAAARPLVFILDELDRCRPTFALEILERIKHFFSVGNVHFVLGIHSAQLHNSIVLTYGPSIDAAKYLQKFISLMFFLFDRADNQRDRTARKFVSYLARVLEFDSKDNELVDTATSIIGDIAVERDMSLREIERVMTTLAIAVSYTPKNYFRPAVILAGLAILKIVAPDLYVKAKRGTLTYDEVQAVLHLEKGADDDSVIHRREWVAKWWRFGTDGVADDDFKSGMQKLSWDYNIRDGKVIVPMIANDVIDRFVPR